MNLPRIVVAGTHSGVGKTSITLGIVGSLRQRGLRVQTFKVGPDYLDPTHLALASGRPCYNLDGWMCGEAYVRQLFARVTANADVAVVEGVMGLFDGADPATSEGSTAEIARWLDAPVLLVLDAHGLGRSVAALVHGYSTFDPKLRIAGVVANRCGSDRHTQWLAESLQSSSLPPLVGTVQRGALPELPSRHLGLVPAARNRSSQATLDQLAHVVGSAVDLEKVLPLQRSTSGPGREVAEKSENAEELSSRAAHGFGAGERSVFRQPASAQKRAALGVARDEAFHFYYPDNLEALENVGCELVPFSPLRDESLPPGLDGLHLGGGYPEVYAAELASNEPMLASIRRFAAERPVYGECGGLMYLSQGIETVDGQQYRMLGLLPVGTRMKPRRQSLGYVDVTLSRKCLWGEPGAQLRGHEFHYSELVAIPNWPTAYDVRYRRSDRISREGFQCGSVLASYAHLHFGSRPGAVENFVHCLAERHE
jgi:cobyrinic acid a,c-diamide synthase